MINTGWNECPGGVLIRFPIVNSLEPVFEYRPKIAGFNLDNTIIESQPKLIADRYKFDMVFQNCIQKIMDLHKQEYSIVVIADQDGVFKGLMSVEDLRYKFDCFVKLLADKHIPVIGIFTTKNNCFRKPHTWCWRMLTKFYEVQHKTIDLKETFFCGNHAGRIAKTPYKRDFDYVDRAFAHNIGIEFKVPEQVFRHTTENREFKYENILDDAEKDEFMKAEYERYKKSPYYNKQGAFDGLLFYCLEQSKKMIANSSDEKIISKKASFMIIMVGPPSCGKTFLSNILARKASKEVTDKDGKKIRRSEFIVVNDKHIINGVKLSPSKRDALLNEAIINERLIILDGNYSSHESRKPYMEKAAEFNLPVIYFKFDTPYKICRHFNHMKFEEKNDYTKEPFTPYVFKKYNKTYQPPDLAAYKAQIPKLNVMLIHIPTLIMDGKAFRNIY